MLELSGGWSCWVEGTPGCPGETKDRGINAFAKQPSRVLSNVILKVLVCGGRMRASSQRRTRRMVYGPVDRQVCEASHDAGAPARARRDNLPQDGHRRLAGCRR